MKLIIRSFYVMAALCCSAAAVRAQVPFAEPEIFHGRGELRLFEFEAGAGANFARHWSGFTREAGTNMFLELRLNRPEPLDFGVQIKAGNVTHRSGADAGFKSTFFRPSLFVDYNWRTGGRTTFFAGAGVGYSGVQNDYFYNVMPGVAMLAADSGGSLSVTPRVGAVLFGGLRLTAEYVLAGGDHSSFGLNAGLVFGGSYRSVGAGKEREGTIFDWIPAIWGLFLPETQW